MTSNSVLSYESAHCSSSMEATMVIEIYSRVEQVPIEEQQKVLAFDWWIHNEDRTLTAIGGNPNLFWDEVEKQLVVIDHNQAFDPDFNAASFLEMHVFSEQWNAISQSQELQATICRQMQLALGKWQDILQSIPSAWWYVDDEKTVSAQIDTQHIYNHLIRVLKNDFWRVA